MTPDTPIPEIDRIDYVTGALPPAARIELQRNLSRNPEMAAAVMAELAEREELLMALGVEGQAFGAPVTGARPAQSGDRAGGWRRAVSARAVRAAALLVVGVGAGLGLGGWRELSGPPRFVELAVDADTNAALRLAMVSQIETAAYDAAEIQLATGIVLPALPPSWAVTDVQVYPSPYGPSVAVTVETADNGPLSIFAVRTGGVGREAPRQSDTDTALSAWFRVSDTAYVLVGRRAPAPLEDEAELLFQALETQNEKRTTG